MKRLNYNGRTETGELLPHNGYDVTDIVNISSLRFGVHKEGNNINSSKRWVVTELSSGFAICAGDWDKPRIDALQKAQEIIEKYGKAEVHLRVSNAVNSWAVSGLAN